MANWCASDDILNTTFSLITSVSNNLWSWKFTRVCFLTQEIQKWHRNFPKIDWFWAIGKFYQNLPFSIYICKRKKMWHYRRVIFFFSITLFQISNIMREEKKTSKLGRKMVFKIEFTHLKHKSKKVFLHINSLQKKDP